jgi:hypothetical protein
MTSTALPPLVDDVRAHAYAYASLGWAVVPIIPGRKYPPFAAWGEAATTDPDVIETWWGGLYPDYGIGIVTGPPSGLWVLDVDVAAGRTGDVTLTELELAHGPLGPTVEAITGTGGRHLYFAWDVAEAVRNDQSGRIGRHVDVRGAGGQVLAPPTRHPDTGRRYRWRPGHEPWV